MHEAEIEAAFNVGCYRKLALALIVSAVKDGDTGFLRSALCDDLCGFVGLGLTGEELADKLERMEPINWQRRPEAIIKAFEDVP